MMTLRQFLIVTGAFILAYNGATILHELGHAIAACATGGTVVSVSVSPLTWSATPYKSPEPMAVTWGGFLLGTMIPLVALGVLWCLKSRLSFWAALLATVALLINGAYMLAGAATGSGDALVLMKLGLARHTLYITGAAMLAAGIALVLPMGTLLGIGRKACGFEKTLLVLGLPIFLYLLTIVAFNLVVNVEEWRLWATALGGGCALMLGLTAIVHLTAAWIGGEETLRRAVPITWPAALASLVAGAAVIVLEILVFP